MSAGASGETEMRITNGGLPLSQTRALERQKIENDAF